MPLDDDPPLPASAEDALAVVEEAVATRDDRGIPRGEAHELLTDAEFGTREADELLDILVDRGHLYAVDGELRVTDRVLDG